MTDGMADMIYGFVNTGLVLEILGLQSHASTCELKS